MTTQSLSDHLLALEERLLQQVVRSDAKVLDGMLADEFREFGSSGRTFTKHQIIDALTVEAPRTIALRDFAMQALSMEVALVTYRSRSEAGEALRSSIWIYRDERWQILFHQGTKVPEALHADAVS